MLRECSLSYVHKQRESGEGGERAGVTPPARDDVAVTRVTVSVTHALVAVTRVARFLAHDLDRTRQPSANLSQNAYIHPHISYSTFYIHMFIAYNRSTTA